MNTNPFLKKGKHDVALRQGGTGYIESPGDTFMNLVWQTRESEPTEYERALCETLAGLFAGGSNELEEIVRGLELSEVRPPAAPHWTEETFLAEIARLAN